MTPETFLAELERRSHTGRAQLVVELGRDPAHAPLFDQLEAGDTSYERRLALQSCATSRQGERVLRQLSDPSCLIRGQARRLLAFIGTDEQVLRATAELPLKNLRRLLVYLRKQKRQGLIDAILQRLCQEQSGAILTSFVGLASSQVAARLLQQEFDRASTEDYTRLARLHPRLALERVLSMVQALSQPNGTVLKRANAVLSAAPAFRTAGERDLAVQLVRELHRFFSFNLVALEAPFLHGNAQALAELVLASGEKVRLSWSAQARHLSVATLLAVIQSQNLAQLNWTAVLQRLPHATRAALYQQFHAGWEDRFGVIPLALLELLPGAQRQGEARRHLQLAHLRATPRQWLPYLALLPAAEAHAHATPFLGDPDPDFRGAALAALVGQARFERGQIGSVLQLLQERAHEQDPVRLAMLAALAALPPSIFGEEHLLALRQLQRKALDARDLSFGTSSQLEHVVVSLLPRFPEWAGVQIAELLQERGQVNFHDLTDRVNKAQMRALGPCLESLFRVWAQREHAPLLAVLGALRRRLRVWDAGAQLLVDLLRQGPTEQLPTAASILAEHRPDRWQEVAPALLAEDESWALVPAMLEFLARHRQDLLSPAILGRRQLQGRFASGHTRRVLPFPRELWKWTPTQQAHFARTLADVLRDPSRDSPGAIFALERLCELPDVPPTLLLEQAQLANPQAAWREAALRVLARLDGGQGITTLLEALDDERARIAIYGLRSALLKMPAATAFTLLRRVSLAKVTVAKEVVRLLGDLALAEAFEFLLEIGGRDLQRDVRVALVRGLWEHLEDARSWVLLEEAAASEDAALATIAARTTHPRLSATARERLNALLARSLRHPDARVRLHVLQHGTMDYHSDPQEQLLEPLLLCLESSIPAEYLTAARALWQIYGSAPPVKREQAVRSAFKRLLPRRQALVQVLSEPEWEYGLALTKRKEYGRLVLEVLAEDDLVLPLRLRLSLHVLPGREFRALVEECVSRGQVHEGVLTSLVQQLQKSNRPALLLDSAFDEWRSSKSPLLRRLALALLIGRAQSLTGWTLERRELLQEFRGDVSPLVAGTAQFTFWPGEENP